MLIHLLENNRQIDDILYVKVGDWIWDCAEEHNRQVEKKLGVNITTIDVSDEIKKGFERWGFPSILNRWCTGIKRDAMRNYIRNKYGERERERALCNTSVTAPMKKKEQIRNSTLIMMLNIH